MRSLASRRILLCCFASFIAIDCITHSPSLAEDGLALRVAPNDGRTQAQQKAVSKNVSDALISCRPVTVLFGSGTYEKFHLVVDIRQQPAACQPSLKLIANGAVFDGAQTPQFLSIVTNKHRFPGEMTGFVIKGYINGVGIAGKSSETSERRTGFRIRRNRFEDLGGVSTDTTAKVKGWGAINFRGVGGNVVTDNEFLGLGNAIESELMHAIYLSRSSGNSIENNAFGAMDGAVIKLRDSSNGNRIKWNRFRYEGDALVQDWYCNKDLRKPGACPVRECPSLDNEVSGNIVVAGTSRDPRRRGGGAARITNPYVSFFEHRGVKLLESYYEKDRLPKSCPPQDRPRVRGLTDNEIRPE